MNQILSRIVRLALGCALAVVCLPAARAELALKPGDHIALVGNALGDRMQHDNWLETLIVAKFPKDELVFRNLAVAGDEVATWHRSEAFGSRDEWLTKVKADVIFACYGFNESFGGAAKLASFKSDLEKFIKHTAEMKYNGKSAPQLVLLSPIAFENLKNPDLPDGSEQNKNLKLYTDAMAEVAKANNVPFVDLFDFTLSQYPKAAKPWTINGFHLNENGNAQVAAYITTSLFGGVTGNRSSLAKLHSAIADKNAEWHARYRTVDGYNVYGGRSHLEFPQGNGKLSNNTVMQEEMAQRDVKTANRDKRVWAVANGGDLKVDDSNLPPVTKVITNRPDVKPYLDPEEAIKHMTVANGCKVSLFASEKEFPELVSPVQMAFDTKGRLWVAAWKNYPERTPTSKIGDSILIFEDTNGDGKADKCIHFLDGLNAPTGFQFYKDGVLVMAAPDLLFARDTDGDGKADQVERVVMGLDSADTHHTTNAMELEAGGATFFSDGVFHRTQMETAWGPVRNEDGCIWRYEPRTGKIERYVPYGFANPHGKAIDYWGNDIITDATGNNSYFGPAFSGFIDYPQKHSGLKEFWARPSRPCPGTGILTSRHFPEEFQGNFLNCNVIGFQGIYRAKMTEDGSGIKGTSIEDLVKSDDPNFRPAAVGVAPDGSIYFTDWAKPLIGHMQHHIRDPNRDTSHGRIYRITYEGRPLLKPAKVDGQPIEALLELLKEPENGTRIRAKIELGKRDTAKVIAATKKWIAKLDSKDPSYEHSMMEALWVHQWHNVVDEELLKRMLRSSDYHARAAATRVLCYWRDRVKDPLALLKVQINDEHLSVRLQAVRACSFFKSREAADVALEVLNKPDSEKDAYIKYCLDETMKQLDKYLKK